MRLSYMLAAAVAVTAMAAGPAVTAAPPALSSMELAEVQSNRYSLPADQSFKAVLSALHTMGFVDIDADKDSGTISAITDSKAKTIFNIFWGFGKKKWTQRASILVEDYGQGSQVRVNLMLHETKARGMRQTSFTDGELIRYGDPYRDFFRILDEEVRRRGGGTSLATDAAAGSTSTDPTDKPGTIMLRSGVKLVPAQTASGYCIKAAPGYVGTGSASSPAISSARPRCT